MITAISNTDGTKAPVQGTAYQYDQLNRIKQMQAYRDYTVAGGDLIVQNNSFSTATNNGDYQTNLTYDANGNILTNVKKGAGGAATNSMDDLGYKYEKNTNKLRYVTDQVGDGNYATDIDNQDIDNYTYDEIGNLKGDVQEQIQNIEWTVYGKVKKVTRTGSSTKDDLEFMYDASGNRVAKIKKPHATLNDPNTWISTFYVRDASGNIMATYDKTYTTGADVVKLDEQYVYGSSRLGLLSRGLDLSQTPEANKFSRTLGQKQFEMSNHLGNVLTVVSDRKILSSAPSSYRLTGINQDFNNGTTVGWDTPGGSLVSISNNRLQVSNSNSDEAPNYRFQDNVAPGGTYSITFDLEAASAMTVKCRIWDVDDSWHLIKEEIYNIGSPGASYTINFSTSCSSTLIDFYSFSSGTFYVDNIRDTPPVAASYTADVKSSSDYYAFGDIMPNRGTGYATTSRHLFNGKEQDVEVYNIAGTSYDYGARIYNPRLGRFLSVDPLTESYPNLTPYQFAANMPIAAIDLDGLEAKIAIFGGSTADPKSVPIFKRFAEADIASGASTGSPHSITRASNFMKLLEQKTTDEGSIERIVIFSHANQYAVFFDDNAGQNTGSSLMRRGTSYGHKDKASVNDIAKGMLNKTIKFEENALVIFAGCNTGSPFGINKVNKSLQGDPIVAYAEDFTKATGISSIGASAKTNFIEKDEQSLLTSDYGFYKFDYDKESKNVIKTFLGKTINASDYNVQTPAQSTPQNSNEDCSEDGCD